MMNTISALFQSTPNEVALATRKIVEMKGSVSKDFGDLGRFCKQPERDVRTAESFIDRWKETKEEIKNIEVRIFQAPSVAIHKSQRSLEH